MDYTELGATGLRVSVAGLGCGGNSRLGLLSGGDEAHAVALVREALDLGVTFFDTARVYGTEHILGRAFPRRERDRLVIATKSHAWRDGRPMSGVEVVASLEESLRRLQTDRVDVYLVHAVAPAHYRHVRDHVLPSLLEEKAKGRIGFVGLSESPPDDPHQSMLAGAVSEGLWDVVMLGFHLLNQQPRHTVFPLTIEHRVGTLLMLVVRNLFSRPERLRAAMARLAAEGAIPAALASGPDPLGFLVHEGGARTLQDAAYRFARHEPGADVVLFGTGDVEHLRANVTSILSPPLGEGALQRLRSLFGEVAGVGLD